jgi:hypothetical protein
VTRKDETVPVVHSLHHLHSTLHPGWDIPKVSKNTQASVGNPGPSGAKRIPVVQAKTMVIFLHEETQISVDVSAPTDGKKIPFPK